MGCTDSRLIEEKSKSKKPGFTNLDPISGSHRIISQDQLLAHEARAIVYSCMDFRLLDDIVIFMNNNGYNNNYDQFILAGASLSFLTDKFKHWTVVAKDHLDLAISLHKIKEIICIEHEKCGAYKMIYSDLTPENERQKHIENVLEFEKIIGSSHPELELHAFYMRIDGSCEKIN
jgi:hypothetical protein